MQFIRTVTQVETSVRISGMEFSILLAIRSRRSKRFRRQVLLSIFRHLKPHFPVLEASLLTHSDSAILDMAKELARPVSIHQALNLRTPAGREGYEIRLHRLRFGQTQYNLAKLAGVSRSQLSRVEHGSHPVSPLFRAKLELAFRILWNREKPKRTIAHTEMRRPSRGVTRPLAR